jgi:GTP:adenosylcobinamide-phosphate guanylyltransferase
VIWLGEPVPLCWVGFDVKALLENMDNGAELLGRMPQSLFDARLFSDLAGAPTKNNKKTDTEMKWSAIVLAGSRGPSDPMARAYGVLHKCMIDIAGTPMIKRVVQSLRSVDAIDDVTVAIEKPELLEKALGRLNDDIGHVMPGKSASASALRAVENAKNFPMLITTGDHPLLTPEMIEYTLRESVKLNADITISVASKDVISASYPETKRTYFPLAKAKVSGCNLFTVHNENGLKLVQRWHALEQNRKKPYRLVAAFGIQSILSFVTGRLTLERAFDIVSKQLGTNIKPLLLPYAEAAIDVDKPSDKDIAELILQRRIAAE